MFYPDLYRHLRLHQHGKHIYRTLLSLYFQNLRTSNVQKSEQIQFFQAFHFLNLHDKELKSQH